MEARILIEEKNKYKLFYIIFNSKEEGVENYMYHASTLICVLEGALNLRIENKDILYCEGQSILVEKCNNFCLSNPGKVKLVMLLLVSGIYLDELIIDY